MVARRTIAVALASRRWLADCSRPPAGKSSIRFCVSVEGPGAGCGPRDRHMDSKVRNRSADGGPDAVRIDVVLTPTARRRGGALLARGCVSRGRIVALGSNGAWDGQPSSWPDS